MLSYVRQARLAHLLRSTLPAQYTRCAHSPCCSTKATEGEAVITIVWAVGRIDFASIKTEVVSCNGNGVIHGANWPTIVIETSASKDLAVCLIECIHKPAAQAVKMANLPPSFS